MFLKFANADLLEARIAAPGGALMKSAHKAVFNYEPREGYLYVRSRAISNRTNDNYDTWPEDELRQAWGTFIGKPVFVNHHNDDVRRKRGVIIDAALHEDIGPDGRPDVWIEVLMEIDAIRFPRLAEAILNRDIERTSMGADVGESECSFCGNIATTPSTYCVHVKSHKGRRLARRNPDGTQEEVLVHEICIAQGEMVSTLRGLVPIENVVVGDMALTRAGWRRVTDARQTGVRPTVKITLSDGTTLRCTEDHLIATAAGWTPAVSLLVGDVDAEATVSVRALAGVHVGVLDGELVTSLAVGLEGMPVIEPVGDGVNQPEMARVDAVALSANVVDFDPLEIMPEKVHHSSVNQSFVVRVATDAPVSIGGSGSLPDQALILGNGSGEQSFQFVQAVCVSHDATVPVYDLTVEGEHEFVANGIVVHNCRKISFFENSVLVEPPADPTAFVVGIDPNGVHDLLDMPPRVSVANRSDDRGSHVELGGDVSQRDLPSASSPPSSRSSSRHATDLDHVGLSELRGSVPNSLGTASAAGHVGRVLSEGAQQPMGGVVAQRGVAGVPNDQAVRDRANERLVAPAVRSDGAALGIVQRQASVPVGEDSTGPRPTGVWSARGVDLTQVPLHDRLGSLESAADHVGYINTGARSFETGSWFHGTNHDFAPGDSVVPGLGAVHGNENDRVWVASNAWVASSYGSRTFEVTPTDKPKPRSKAGEFFCSGATVVREISNDEIRQAGNSWWEQTSKRGKLSSDAYVELTEEQKSRFAGTTVRQDDKGYYCHTHRARSKSYASIDEIPDDEIGFIESTGAKGARRAVADFEGEVQEEMTKMATKNKRWWRHQAAIEGRGTCGRCHETKTLAGSGAICRDCLDAINRGEPMYDDNRRGEYDERTGAKTASTIQWKDDPDSLTASDSFSVSQIAYDGKHALIVFGDHGEIFHWTVEDRNNSDYVADGMAKTLESAKRQAEEAHLKASGGQLGMFGSKTAAEEKPDLITWDEWEMAGSTNYGLGYSAGSPSGISLQDAIGWAEPTDIEAFTRGFEDARAGRAKTGSIKLAWGETKAPPQVNTLGLNECPVCGTSNQFDSTGRCMTCGHLPAPDPFREPDLDVAQKVDMRDGWVNPDLLSAPAFVPPAEGGEGGEENQQPDAPKDPVQVTSSATEVVEGLEGDTMRPAAAVIASQDQRIRRLNAENAVLRRRAGLAPKTADEDNPAQPVPEPAESAPAQTTDEARAADATTDVTTPGSELTNVSPMSTTDVSTPGSTATDVSPTATADVTSPVAGTTEMRPYNETVTLVQPDASGASNGTDRTNAYDEDNSWVQAKIEAARQRTYACLRLARLRVTAGLASGDDLVIAQQIEASRPSNDALRTEIQTLSAVVQRQASAAPAGPRRQAQRSAPSLASIGSPIAHVAARGVAEDDPVLW